MYHIHRTISQDLRGFLQKHKPELISEINCEKPCIFINEALKDEVLQGLHSIDPFITLLFKFNHINGNEMGLWIVASEREEFAGFYTADTEPWHDVEDWINGNVPTKLTSKTKEEIDEDINTLKNADLEIQKLLNKFNDSMEDEVKKMDINKLANEGNAKCSECGRKDITLTILVDANTGEAERKCLVCMGKSTPSELKEKDFDRINDDIKRYEDLAKKYEQLISEFDISGIPTALENYGPVGMYRSILAIIADMKTDRAKILSKMDTLDKLNRQLQWAIEREDYEDAAILREKIQEKNKK